jgi:hypothetical protein
MTRGANAIDAGEHRWNTETAGRMSAAAREEFFKFSKRRESDEATTAEQAHARSQWRRRQQQ